jgi:hypothetical protein
VARWAAFAPLLLAGCAAMHEPSCAPGGQSMTSDFLYFGTARPGGAVTPAEWTEFLAGAVTPRFPDGLTTWDAAGQWKPPGGALVHEATHVLNVVHKDDESSEAAIQAIVGDYKARFRQESVLRVSTKGCASF